LREYEVGDDLRRVHWRSTARTGELMLRQDEMPWESRSTILLDTRPSTHQGESFERAVEIAASLATAMCRGRRQVRFVTTGGVEIRSSGVDRYAQIMEYLAGASVETFVRWDQVIEGLRRSGEGLLAAVGAHGIGLATRRWPVPVALAASALPMGLLICAVVAGHTTFYGLPTHSTLSALARAWTAGLDSFRNAVAPTKVTPGLLLLSVGGTWICAAAADWLAFRGDATLTALLPPFVLYVMGAALGKDGFQLPTTFVSVLAALLFVAANHAAGLPSAWFSGRGSPPGLTRLAMGAAPVALLVAAAGLVLGPNLPGAQAQPLVELRGTGGGGDTSRITVSPLADLK